MRQPSRPTLTAEQRIALRALASHAGWVRVHGSPDMHRQLCSLGYAEGDGHGKFRITDDGRERDSGAQLTEDT